MLDAILMIILLPIVAILFAPAILGSMGSSSSRRKVSHTTYGTRRRYTRR